MPWHGRMGVWCRLSWTSRAADAASLPTCGSIGTQIKTNQPSQLFVEEKQPQNLAEVERSTRVPIESQHCGQLLTQLLSCSLLSLGVSWQLHFLTLACVVDKKSPQLRLPVFLSNMAGGSSQCFQFGWSVAAATSN